MSAALRTVYESKGLLSGIIIDECEGLPSSSAYSSRFGSLLRAYSLVGYSPDRDYRYLAVNRALRRLHPDILREVLEGLKALKPDVVVADSIQTLWADGVEAAPGTVAQVRACAGELIRLAKRRGVTVLLVLFPLLPLPRIVAADIAYAVPLTLVAGIGHLWIGNFNGMLLLNLLMAAVRVWRERLEPGRATATLALGT